MLQTRNGKRTGLAAVRVAIDMAKEGLITKEEAVLRVEPDQIYDFLVPRLVEKGEKIEVLATGLPASPGAARRSDRLHRRGSCKGPVPQGLQGHHPGARRTPRRTSPAWRSHPAFSPRRGGMTSHAAVVTRGMGKCCVAGAGDCVVDEAHKQLRVKGHTYRHGDWISLDGTTGRVIAGQLKTLPVQPDDADLVTFMSWADPLRKVEDPRQRRHPRDAKQALLFGAEASASAAQSTCSLPRTASSTCAP